MANMELSLLAKCGPSWVYSGDYSSGAQLTKNSLGGGVQRNSRVGSPGNPRGQQLRQTSQSIAPKFYNEEISRSADMAKVCAFSSQHFWSRLHAMRSLRVIITTNYMPLAA
jgi:hypothetical protein